MKFKTAYLDIARYAVEKAAKSSAAKGEKVDAEACVVDTESIQINVSGRAVEQMNAVKEAGIGVRVLREGRMAFGSTNDLTNKAVSALVEDLVGKAVYHTADEFHVIPGKEDGAVDGSAATGFPGADELANYDPRMAEIPVQEKIRTALRIEESGLDASPKIAGSMMVVYQDWTSFTYLANSKGASGWFNRTGCGGAGMFSAVEGDWRESGMFVNGVVRWEDFDPDEIGRKGAGKALSMLGARSIPSAELTLVLSPEIGSEMWSFVAGMLSADAVQKGRSLFADKIESEVAAKDFTLVDDGRLKGGMASAPVDGEGVATQATSLITGGVLKTYLYDSYTARKGGVRSTGNRSRSGYGSAGGVGTTNLYLKPGAASPDAILAGIDRGFYITVVLGLHAAVDTASGDFSIPAAGFMIEKGKKTFPVRGVTVGGNLFEMLKAVDKVGSDLTWFQTAGSPTVSVSQIKIGGSSS